jgi:glycosyltransferase involved in cell wall biosynthesis
MWQFLKKFYFYFYIFITFWGLCVVLPFSLLLRLLRTRPNSLWAGTPILTLPLKARAERMLGVNAKSLVYESYGISRDGYDIHLGDLCSLPILGRFIPMLTFLYACCTQDRLHFFYDRGLLPPFDPDKFNKFELLSYKFLRIKTFFWAYGADVRTRKKTLSLGDVNCCILCPVIPRACICIDSSWEKKYSFISSLATRCFSMGDMMQYTPGSENRVFYWPLDLNCEGGKKYDPVYPVFVKDTPLIIAHAANHRQFKGTKFLINAVNELIGDGYLIELRLIEGMTNIEALRNYRAADLIFDQCLIGFHGYFALEGMALGKPVMSFIRNPKNDLLAPDECPIINTSIKTIKKDISSIYRNRSELGFIGKRGREYIEKHFTINAVSRRMGIVYKELGL